jgi:hypothetical protein
MALYKDGKRNAQSKPRYDVVRRGTCSSIKIVRTAGVTLHVSRMDTIYEMPVTYLENAGDGCQAVRRAVSPGADRTEESHAGL